MTNILYEPILHGVYDITTVYVTLNIYEWKSTVNQLSIIYSIIIYTFHFTAFI